MIPFLSGVLATLIAAALYLLHVERTNRRLIHTLRLTERRRAYAQGYRDRAILALRHARRDLEDGS
jgi:hypothetical protein